MFASHSGSSIARSCLFLFALLVLGNNIAGSTASNTLVTRQRKECVVQPGGSNATDDAVAIRQAFQECGHGGKVVFLNETYYVNSVMNTSGLEDVDIELHGKLLVRAPFPLLLSTNRRLSSTPPCLILEPG